MCNLRVTSLTETRKDSKSHPDELNRIGQDCLQGKDSVFVVLPQEGLAVGAVVFSVHAVIHAEGDEAATGRASDKKR